MIHVVVLQLVLKVEEDAAQEIIGQFYNLYNQLPVIFGIEVLTLALPENKFHFVMIGDVFHFRLDLFRSTI